MMGSDETPPTELQDICSVYSFKGSLRVWGEFLSKMWSNFRWSLGRVPTVGGATMAKAEPPMQHLF